MNGQRTAAARPVKARPVSRRLELRVGDRVTYGAVEYEVVLPGAGKYAELTDGKRTFWHEKDTLTLVARGPKTGRRS